MIIDIMPTKKLPRSLSLLSYQVPKDLRKKIKVGQLVNIPLRNSITTGLIAKIHKQSKPTRYSLKNIISLVSPKIIFTNNQIKLFLELSNYYHLSASLFVHFNLPKLIKKDWHKLPSQLPLSNSPAPRQVKPNYLWWQTKEERNKFYLQKIKLTKKNKGQTLIVVPRINDIYNLALELNLEKSQFTPIHRQLSRADNFNSYLQAIGQTPTTFIGTRSSLFYPFTCLNTIIIDEENSLDHKQYDMNPRYDVMNVAQVINSVYRTRVIFYSSSPSLNCYHQFKLKSPKPTSKRSITLANLNHELDKKNYSFISDILEKQIKKTLKMKQSIFLFVNKKGESSTTACRDCQFTFTCPSCQLPLIKTKSNQLVCYYCQQTEEMPPFCPKCSGPNFKSTGLGIQKVETTLKKLFPKTHIIRIDKEQKESPVVDSKSIVVGTEFALDKIDWTEIGLIGIANADNLWQHTEFMAAETAYGLLTKLLTLPPKNANIIIQTFRPEHYIIQAVSRNKPKVFYWQELKFRKKFDYPPFTNLIKLSYLNKSEAKAENQAEKLRNKLRNSDKITVSPAMPISRRKIRTKYKFNIIIKLKDLRDFHSIAKHIPNDWLIDIHPRRLLD